VACEADNTGRVADPVTGVPTLLAAELTTEDAVELAADEAAELATEDAAAELATLLAATLDAATLDAAAELVTLELLALAVADGALLSPPPPPPPHAASARSSAAIKNLSCVLFIFISIHLICGVFSRFCGIQAAIDTVFSYGTSNKIVVIGNIRLPEYSERTLSDKH